MSELIEYEELLRRVSKLDREMLTRLKRVESKLVRGFEELGISTDKKDDWIHIDDEARVVYIDTVGRSIMVLLSDMARVGATHFGQPYEIIHKEKSIGYVVLQPIT
jgi:hypothetical protein